MQKTPLCLLAALLMTSACVHAGDAAKIHVDMDAVSSSAELQPVDGITSTGQPNAEQFALIREAGYVAVVDLRGPNEDRGLDEAAVVTELGLDYIELPISGRDAISNENAAKLDQILASYDGPVLVHCGSGNRVGALLALRKSMAGADAEEALAYGRSAGLTGLEPVVRERLEQQD